MSEFTRLDEDGALAHPEALVEARSVSIGGTGVAPPSTRRLRILHIFILTAGAIAIGFILLILFVPPVVHGPHHELSAVQTVRAIQQAEMQFESTYPANGYTCELKSLGGDPSAGPPSPTGAQILQGDITSGFKSGYVISISNCQKVSINGTDHITRYKVNAVPQTVGKTGKRGYCGDESGVLHVDPNGGSNCTQLLQ